MHFSVCVLWITILQQNNETFSIGISGQILSTNETAEPLSIQRPAVPLSLHSTISRHKTQERCTKYSTNVLGIWPAPSGRGWTSPQTQNVQHRPMAENYVVNALLNRAIHCNRCPGQNFCWASTMTHTFFPAMLGRLLYPPCLCAGCSHYLGRPSLCTSPTRQAPPIVRSHRPPPQASAFSPMDLLMCSEAHKILAIQF